MLPPESRVSPAESPVGRHRPESSEVANSRDRSVAVKFEYSPRLLEILNHVNASLAITTYQAGKLAVVGVAGDQLDFTFHDFEQVMGIAVGPDAIAVGSRRDIHVLRAAKDIAPFIAPAGTYDAAYLSRHSFRTGNIHGHEMAWGREGLWIVNTLFSSLCTLDQNFSFVPRWRPPFISKLEANDRCHLNGLAMHDGKPKYVAAHGDSDEPGGWRTAKATGGVVIDVDSGETVSQGFAMPHSPRIAMGRLWVLNSGAGQLGTIDVATGRFEPVTSFPGFTRGLAFHGQFAFVGLSKIRETSVFGGMPIEKDRANLRCGVGVVDLVSGQQVAMLQFHSGVDEIFAVSVIPGCKHPCIVGPNESDSSRTDIWIVPTSAAAPGQLEERATFPVYSDNATPAEKAAQLVALAEDLQRKGQLREAVQSYRSALQLEPNRAAWHCNLGNLWQQMDDQDRAIACYEQALQVDAGCIPARQNLGYLLFNHGRTEEAVAQYDALVKLNASPINRLLAASVLPVVYDSKTSVEVWRRRLTEWLDALIADGGTVDATESLVPTSFFLAYQGLNDADVMRCLGRICVGSEVVPRHNMLSESGGRGWTERSEGSPGVSSIRSPTPATPSKASRVMPRSDGRLRIGFLSAYFRDHTIGRLNLGRIQHLDRNRFEVTVLSATGREDSVAAQFRAAADRYCQIPRDVKAARALIADQDLDVLIFADVGMDALTATLAWSRMAPVQCVTWGHPDTTGSPFMDYFLSSELLETDDANAHYTERLVRLPLLATYFERPVAQSKIINHQSSLHTYLCPQTLFKFHPDFDEVLAGILSRDPNAEIVLLEGRVPHWTNRLKQRLEKTLPGGSSRVRFLPAMPRDEFMNLLANADVILDPLHFGGGHTSYEALAVGTPIVTLPGEFLRSRITQALYRKMGFTELIVSSPEQYIDSAVRLGTDQSERSRVSARILETCPVLFEDAAEVRCLEDWLWSLT